MIRKLTATTLIGTLIGALALGVFERLQAPVAPTAQMLAVFTLRYASVRDVFP